MPHTHCSDTRSVRDLAVVQELVNEVASGKRAPLVARRGAMQRRSQRGNASAGQRRQVLTACLQGFTTTPALTLRTAANEAQGLAAICSSSRLTRRPLIRGPAAKPKFYLCKMAAPASCAGC